MEIYSFYNAFFYLNLNMNGITGISFKSMMGMLAISILIWLAFFLLQGFGLFTMAKRRNFKNAFLAFVPFANLLLIDKLAGDCEIFGHKMKRGGMYAMIAEIIVVLTALALSICEGILFTRYAEYISYNSSAGEILWLNLDSFGSSIYSFYSVWGAFINSIFTLAYELLLLVLMISLLKRYSAKNYTVLSMLQLFVPIARYVMIFVLRNNKSIDYNEYKRAKYESYMRRNAPYGNPYGTPYGTPYGNPYSNPYGNPYAKGGQNGSGANQAEQNPFDEFGTKNDDPFEDINNYSSNSSNSSNSSSDSESTENKSGDDFF